MICLNCKSARAKKGGSSPSTALNRWVPKLVRALERRDKAELTMQDKHDAESLTKTPPKHLSKQGRRLVTEALAQLEYFNTMKGLDKNLAKKTYKLAAADSSPGLSSLFGSAEQLCRDNPKFRNSVVIAMLQGAVAKSLHGKRAKVNEKLTDFVRFMYTVNPNAAMVMSANIGGCSKRHLRRINAEKRTDCIIDAGRSLPDSFDTSQC